jgi:phosphoglycerate kinase
MLSKKTIKDIDIRGKKVLVRVDFNLPLDEKGEITDDLRIRASLATIKYILENKASAILLSHMGRPKGKIVESLRLTSAAKRLGELLRKKVRKISDCVGEEARRAAEGLKPGEVLLLENTRFHIEEEENDSAFAKELASLGDVYVDDSFSTIHRDHASVTGIPKFTKPAVAGLLLSKEIEYLEKIMTSPERPFVALLGGAKVSTKISVIHTLLSKVDQLLIGGGMCFTFFSALKFSVGKSIVEEDFIECAKDVLLAGIAQEKPIHLPSDVVVAPFVSDGAPTEVVKRDSIPKEKRGVDIGPETVKRFSKMLKKASCVFWNGPVGVFEIDKFSKGTEQIAKALAESAATTIIGGGDTAAALTKFGLSEKMTHISTGGGACLEFIAQKELPGLEILEDMGG